MTETRNINRRQFILASIAVSMSAVLGFWWIAKVRDNDITDIVRAILARKTPYLRFEESELEKFCAAYVSASSDDFVIWNLSWKGLFSPFVVHTSLLDSTDVLDEFGEAIARQFLLSTDFFREGADIERSVRFAGLYDPYSRYCPNPFARIDL